MPQTYRAYRIWEVALAVQGFSPLATGMERAQEGDIIRVRYEIQGIGFKEMSEFLWVRVQGKDDADMEILWRMYTVAIDELSFDRFEKRQYSISFDRLKVAYPALDLVRVRDIADIYQPFLSVEEDTGRYIETSKVPPLDINGLVFDKKRMVVF